MLTDNISISDELLKKPDKSLFKAFWVLLDFIDRAEFHTASDYPVQISSFSVIDIYEIIYIARPRYTGRVIAVAEKVIRVDVFGDVNSF